MCRVRVGIIGIILALLAGCEGGTETGTTFPTTPPVMPPEADQMKSDMMKRAHLKSQGTARPRGPTAK